MSLHQNSPAVKFLKEHLDACLRASVNHHILDVWMAYVVWVHVSDAEEENPDLRQWDGAAPTSELQPGLTWSYFDDDAEMLFPAIMRLPVQRALMSETLRGFGPVHEDWRARWVHIPAGRRYFQINQTAGLILPQDC